MGLFKVLEHVTDVIYFGALAKCNKCKNGDFVFKNSGYVCTGNISEWAKCDNIEKEPKRIPVRIPEYLRTEYSFLSGKFKVQTRAIKAVAAVPLLKNVKKEENGTEE